MKKLLFCILITSFSLNVTASNIKKSIFTKDAPAPIGTYSQAIQFDNIVYISGQIGIDPKTGELVPGSFKDQAKQVFLNLANLAKAAGGTTDDILKLTIYLTDLNDFKAVNDTVEAFFSEPYPARAAIEIKALPKQAKIEVEAIMSIKK